MARAEHSDEAGGSIPKVHLLLSLVAICWLLAKIIGWKLWIADRAFPIIPPLDFLYAVPAMVHRLLYASSMVLLSLLVLRPGNALLQRGLLISELCSCLLDQNRWQPWEYLYLFIVLIFIISRNKPSAIASCLVVSLATIYVYSGIHKFNGGFLTGIWENMVLKKFLNLPTWVYSNSWVHYCGLLLPFIETLSGMALLSRKTRKAGAFLLVAMHCFILLLVGPLGLNYESIIWPWNIAMILLILSLYVLSPYRAVNPYQLNKMSRVSLICWILLPALNFAGAWDNSLSWKLYSANLPQMVICVKKKPVSPIPEGFLDLPGRNPFCDGYPSVNLQAWAMKELNVPAYPQERTYRSIMEHWGKHLPPGAVDFNIYYFKGKPVRNN